MELTVEQIGVHVKHCCKEHGCKHWEETCPVVDGTHKQEYPCEDCGDWEREFNLQRFVKEQRKILELLHPYLIKMKKIDEKTPLCKLLTLECKEEEGIVFMLDFENDLAYRRFNVYDFQKYV